MPLPEPRYAGSQVRCIVDELLLVGCACSFSAVGYLEELRKKMAADGGLGRFVAERGPIVYIPGGGSSWRGII